MDESHPGLGHGFVIAFFQVINGCIPRFRQGLESCADFCDGFVERMAAQVKVSDFDVVAMVAVVERAGFEGGEEFVVGHGEGCRD